MKKKGLIIATIVMVLVLAVSLTTATYAWFTTSGSATVSAVTLSTTASTDIFIGVEKDNAYDTSSNPNNFYSDNTTYDGALSSQATKWVGDTNGLGLSVTHTVSLANLQQAVYSFDTSPTLAMTTYTKGSGQTVSTGIDMTATLKKANGTGGGTSWTDSGIADAVENVDYLNIAFGAYPGKDDVMAYGCLVKVSPTDSLQSLGINAAIHVAYSLNNATWVDVDAYGDSRYTTTKTNHGTPSMPKLVVASGAKAGTYTYEGVSVAAGDALVWIPIETNTDSTYCTQYDMNQLQLVIYVCGPDNDCITAAMGVSASISINFISVNGRQEVDNP